MKKLACKFVTVFCFLFFTGTLFVCGCSDSDDNGACEISTGCGDDFTAGECNIMNGDFYEGLTCDEIGSNSI